MAGGLPMLSKGCTKIICYWFLSRGGNEHRPEDGDDLERYELSNLRRGKVGLGHSRLDPGYLLPERWSNPNAGAGTRSTALLSEYF